MPTIHETDKIEGSSAEIGNLDSRIVRRFVVKDISVTDGGEFNALLSALAAPGMPQTNDQHPVVSGTRVTRHVVRGMSGNTAICDVVYETPTGGGTPQASFILRNSVGLQSIPVQLTDRFVPLVVTVSSTASGQLVQDTKQCTANKFTPIERLEAWIVQGTRPSIDWKQAVGRVNDKPWQGYPRGHWLCDGVSAEDDNVTANYRITCSFISRIHWPWREYGWFYDALGNVPRSVLTATGTIQTAMQASYNPNPGVNDTTQGFATFDIYETADFGAIFGIL